MYSKFIFKNIKNDDYKDCNYSNKWRTWNINCANRFEIFTTQGYDKVVFFDADMIVMDNIDYLFEIDVEFGGCEIVRDSEIDHPSKFDRTLRSFNGGLMVISKKYLNSETKNNLIKVAEQKPWSSDEPILNTYFDNTRVTFLPKCYNLLVPEVTAENFSTAKIIHYLSEKKVWYQGCIEDRYDEFIIKKLNNFSLLIKIDNLFRLTYNKALKYYGI